MSETPENDKPKKKRGWFARFTGAGEEPEQTPQVSEEPPKQPAEAEATEPPVVTTEAPATTTEPPVAATEPPAPEPEAEPVEEPAPEPVEELETAEEPEKKGWFARLKAALSKSSGKLSQGITDLFTKRKLDDEALEDLEDLLITSDLGVSTAGKLSAALAKTKFGKEVDADEVRAVLAEEISKMLEPVAVPLDLKTGRKPHVVLVVGVNGAGKTTTIGKMAKEYTEQGLQVSLAAGDTFRAAAVEQLKVWGERTGCPVVSRDIGADAAGLAYDALEQAKERGDDILFVDTAGRLQNKEHLMDELKKVVRVIKKVDETAPHSTLMVIDATVGQNAHSQVEVFRDMVAVDGLVMTKLDGTAKGGVMVSLAEKFGLPVHYVGVGEGVDDLKPFAAEDFARGLLGLDQENPSA